eukprot:4025650-Pleurochrysis_carterae.AAC.1
MPPPSAASPLWTSTLRPSTPAATSGEWSLTKNSASASGDVRRPAPKRMVGSQRSRGSSRSRLREGRGSTCEARSGSVQGKRVRGKRHRETFESRARGGEGDED